MSESQMNAIMIAEIARNDLESAHKIAEDFYYDIYSKFPDIGWLSLLCASGSNPLPQ